MKNFDLFVWSADFSDYTGEGLIARCFFKNYLCKKYKNIKIKIVSANGIYLQKKKKISIIKKKKFNNNFYTKYILLFYGILLIWYYHFKKKKTCYLNYLPLWNFLIFLLLPSKTILGPITGNIYNNNIKCLESFVRVIFFPIFYYISIKIIFKKFKIIIFGSNNLQNLIPKEFLKYCIFNFCLSFYKNRKKKIKKIDFALYLRNRKTKSVNLIKDLAKKLHDNGFSVVVFGEKFIYKNVKNYTNISRQNLLPILDQAFIALNPGDNLYSLFLLDCLSCNLTVFFDKTLIKKKIIFIPKQSLIALDFNNSNLIYESLTLMLKKIIKKKKITKSQNIFYKEQCELKNKIETLLL